jgi:hypothetical protein
VAAVPAPGAVVLDAIRQDAQYFTDDKQSAVR